MAFNQILAAHKRAVLISSTVPLTLHGSIIIPLRRRSVADAIRISALDNPNQHLFWVGSSQIAYTGSGVLWKTFSPDPVDDSESWKESLFRLPLNNDLAALICAIADALRTSALQIQYHQQQCKAAGEECAKQQVIIFIEDKASLVKLAWFTELRAHPSELEPFVQQLLVRSAFLNSLGADVEFRWVWDCSIVHGMDRMGAAVLTSASDDERNVTKHGGFVARHYNHDLGSYLNMLYEDELLSILMDYVMDEEVEEVDEVHGASEVEGVDEGDGRDKKLHGKAAEDEEIDGGIDEKAEAEEPELDCALM